MLLVLAAALHVTGILFDLMLQGTLPITNVYSGLILTGAIGVVVGAAVERRHRNGVGLNVAAILGLSALVGAHGLAPGGVAALAAQVFSADFLLAALVTVLVLVLRPTRVPLHQDAVRVGSRTARLRQGSSTLTSRQPTS